jgi:myo-inositol-1(or 4)-monophosphatase
MTALSPPQLDARAETALELAKSAVTLITDPMGAPEHLLKDGVADWVTSTDLAVERFVRDRLAHRFPDDSVVGEEFDNTPAPPGCPVWYVDPVDGTTNFVNGLRICSFSLAVADDAGIAVGVVADVWRNEIFSAVRGAGAHCGDYRMRCREDTTLEGGLVLIELLNTELWDGMTHLMKALGKNACVTRVIGSSALSLANVAAGRAAGVVLGGAHPIDVAAGVLLAREAGAVVRTGPAVDRVLGPAELGAGPALVAAAPGVLAALLGAVEVGRPEQASANSRGGLPRAASPNRQQH